MNDLLPCPWCGCADNHLELNTDNHGDWRVYCEMCVTQGPHGVTENDAIAAWNRRADPAPADGESVMGVVQLHDNHCKEEDYCHCAVVVPKSWEYRKVRVTLV